MMEQRIYHGCFYKNADGKIILPKQVKSALYLQMNASGKILVT